MLLRALSCTHTHIASARTLLYVLLRALSCTHTHLHTHTRSHVRAQQHNGWKGSEGVASVAAVVGDRRLLVQHTHTCFSVGYLCNTHTSASCDKTFSFQDLLVSRPPLLKTFSCQGLLLFNSCPAVLDSTNPSFFPISFALYCKGPGATGQRASLSA